MAQPWKKWGMVSEVQSRKFGTVKNAVKNLSGQERRKKLTHKIEPSEFSGGQDSYGAVVKNLGFVAKFSVN